MKKKGKKQGLSVKVVGGPVDAGGGGGHPPAAAVPTARRARRRERHAAAALGAAGRPPRHPQPAESNERWTDEPKKAKCVKHTSPNDKNGSAHSSGSRFTRKEAHLSDAAKPTPAKKRRRQAADGPSEKCPSSAAAAAAALPLPEAINLELARWAIMDKIVETYDAQLACVLGGGDSKRNEQKRKRHLETWLWSRSFHPLLPLGKPSEAAVAQGDAALAQKLQNAGLSAKEACRRLEALARVLAAPPKPPGSLASAVTLAASGAGDRMILTCSGKVVDINRTHWEKLKRLHVGDDFASAAFLLLARYRVLQVHAKGGGNQGAIPPLVWQAIHRWAQGAVVEAFASPLNTLSGRGRFHSAFTDVDASFGSRGSFFEADFSEGVVEVNPPFDEELVLRAAGICEQALEAASRAKRLLTFVVIIPETDWKGHAAFLESRFKRAHRTALSGQHFYVVGNQHTNAQQCYPASRNTTIMILSSQLVSGV